MNLGSVQHCRQITPGHGPGCVICALLSEKLARIEEMPVDGAKMVAPRVFSNYLA
jgi:hypothetical protein